MGALWAAAIGVVLAGVPLTEPGPARHEPPAVERLEDPGDARFVTYLSTFCCGSMVCGGCTCIPCGVMVPLTMFSGGAADVFLAGLVVGGAMVALGVASMIGGAGGYAAVIAVLWSMGLWDPDAATESWYDVMALFSLCWRFL